MPLTLFFILWKNNSFTYKIVQFSDLCITPGSTSEVIVSSVHPECLSSNTFPLAIIMTLAAAVPVRVDPGHVLTSGGVHPGSMIINTVS